MSHYIAPVPGYASSLVTHHNTAWVSVIAIIYVTVTKNTSGSSNYCIIAMLQASSLRPRSLLRHLHKSRRLVSQCGSNFGYTDTHTHSVARRQQTHSQKLVFGHKDVITSSQRSNNRGWSLGFIFTCSGYYNSTLYLTPSWTVYKTIEALLLNSFSPGENLHHYHTVAEGNKNDTVMVSPDQRWVMSH